MSLSLLDFGDSALGCFMLLRAILLCFILVLLDVNRGCSILHVLLDDATFVCLIPSILFGVAVLSVLFESAVCWPCCCISRSCILSGFSLLYVALCC